MSGTKILGVGIKLKRTFMREKEINFRKIIEVFKKMKNTLASRACVPEGWS